MSLPVVVLAKNSLFAGGIASRLKDDSDIFNMTVINLAGAENAVEQLLHINPEIVIVDALDVRATEELPIIGILEILPKARIIQLNCSENGVRVFSSEEWEAHKTDELFTKMLESVTDPKAIEHTTSQKEIENL
ncbi:MAG: hypothetical protein HN390_14495 [Anaerolineae bacterium]|jgi:hypothetical protein|nr:hypothetical protein [Anaerolineae bacterium]MBT7190668.1 hypothetical protein [Anaerolineae bacterium]MBT7991308.1 hypothetical protein [Anaerolineae bacterium]